jgi:Zn-dependent protease with chaperone function
MVFTNMAIELTLWFFSAILLGPCIALVWRTRRYLADASAVELTRDPDALAGALERLARDNASIPGGSWATHLFVIDPKGDHSVSVDRQPTPEQIRQAAAAWAASQAGATSAHAALSDAADYARLKQEIMSTGFAAFRGDAQAGARLQAFAQTMAAAYGEDAASVHIPNLADLAAARRGDRSAIARLRGPQQDRAQRTAKSGQTGLQSQSSVSFHPPLKKRLKRLERMGAHLPADVHRRMGRVAMVFTAVAALVIVPLLALAAGAMLLVIAMMIGLNLVFLTLWLAVIHAVFVWLNSF